MWEGPLPIIPPGGFFRMKRGKKYQEAVKSFDKAAQYDVAEAISLVKKNATAKFDETIELHIRTGCDGRHADNSVQACSYEPHVHHRRLHRPRSLLHRADQRLPGGVQPCADRSVRRFQHTGELPAGQGGLLHAEESADNLLGILCAAHVRSALRSVRTCLQRYHVAARQGFVLPRVTHGGT